MAETCACGADISTPERRFDCARCNLVGCLRCIFDHAQRHLDEPGPIRTKVGGTCDTCRLTFERARLSGCPRCDWFGCNGCYFKRHERTHYQLGDLDKMDIRTAYSSFLKAADVDSAGGSVRLRIKQLAMEKLKNKDGDEEEKPVLFFQNAEKGLVLNKTNANRIASVHGWETDEWTGKVIELYTESVEAFGKMTDAIRVRVPKPAAAKPAIQRQTQPMQSDDGDEEPPPLDDADSVPF